VFKQIIDYDSPMNQQLFNLTVYVQDANTSHIDTAYIEVRVTDYNDNAPVFSPNQQRVTIYENATVGTTLTRFTVNDRDTGENKQFR
jgi:protocadherin alpha